MCSFSGKSPLFALIEVCALIRTNTIKFEQPNAFERDAEVSY